MMDKLIYLASPYSDANPSVVARRVRQVQLATAKLIEQGHLIFSPIVHSHPIADLVRFNPLNTSEALSDWLSYDKAFIDKCDELWVLTAPGYETSRGVKAEIAHASEIGKPIRFVSFPDFEPSTFSYTLDARHNQLRVALDNKATIDVAYEGKLTPEGVRYFRDLIEKHKRRDAERIYTGAGKFYSPPSSGKPPLCYCLRFAHIGGYEKPFTCHHCRDASKSKSEAQTTSLPEDADERNSYPMAEGCLYYFPNALAEVSKISHAGNEQHNPGQPMHWSRGKSTDHANKIIRHLVDAGREDEASIAHAANCAWRALALLQEKIERVRNVPMPKNAWVDSDV